MPPVSNRTIAILAEPFQGGSGPSHGTLELVWAAADASDYLPDREMNKMERVLAGLQRLRDGVPDRFIPGDGLSPDDEKLREVVADLSTRLLGAQLLDPDRLANALANDGFVLERDRLTAARPEDEPADRLAAYLDELFGESDDFEVARNHYGQATEAFERQHWESANAQFRSALDATYDAIAAKHGCPESRTGGAARQWLATQGLLEEDESQLLKAFASFAGSAGSHAGMSDATECQLRRHFVTALIVFGITKLG